MKPDVYWIEGPWVGQLGIVPRPRGGDWLEDDVKAWRLVHINIVVSMLTHEENRELKIEREAESSRKQGIDFRSFPIIDRSTPDRYEDVLKIVMKLEDALNHGQNVVVHCRQGIGRSAILAASILVHAGINVDDSFKLVEKARGRPVPDTIDQRQWVEEFSEFSTSPTQSSASLFVQEG